MLCCRFFICVPFCLCKLLSFRSRCNTMRVSVVAGLVLLGISVRTLYNLDQVVHTSGSKQPDFDDYEPTDTEAAKKAVIKFIRANRVAVFSKVRQLARSLPKLVMLPHIPWPPPVLQTYCGYSRRAKEVLTSHLGASGFASLELDTRSDGAAIQAYMQQLTGASTMPRVFIDGVFLGGADETVRQHMSGELLRKLKKGGIL